MLKWVCEDRWCLWCRHYERQTASCFKTAFFSPNLTIKNYCYTNISNVSVVDWNPVTLSASHAMQTRIPATHVPKWYQLTVWSVYHKERSHGVMNNNETRPSHKIRPCRLMNNYETPLWHSVTLRQRKIAQKVYKLITFLFINKKYGMLTLSSIVFHSCSRKKERKC